ncbi:TetR/AcrR family transcriptional regulator [Parapedobacter tibetensis]|uniref:TetR/AcrR family transcriptional regulator n=1 Tax=Parapedobacter tibetensis TaxID=2972951 RepID=UPI00214DCFC3|nr:TetR/AcrR family transcriptional regulator [Parapedobacter tibetensis]
MRNPSQTKLNILVRSGDLFNTQGYRATSIANITKSTGFTKGAIYRHFENKEELENQALMHLSTVMFQKLRERIKKQATAPDKLRSILRFFESYISNPPLEGGCPLMNAAIEADDAHPSLKKGANKVLNLLEESIITILDNGIRFKQLKPEIDKKSLATLLIASLEGAIMMSKLRDDNDAIINVVKHLEIEIKKTEL